MKRFPILLLLLLFLCPSHSFSQFIDGYSLALIGNRSTVVADKFDDFRNYNEGYGLGLHVDKTFSRHLSIQSGLEFSALRTQFDFTQQETNSNGEPTGYTFGGKTTSSLYILSVPLVIKVKGPYGFFAYTGPRFDFKLGDNNGDIVITYHGNTTRDKDNLYDYSEPFIAGWSAGVGKRLNIAGFNPSIAVRYNGDLSKLVDETGFFDMHKRRFELIIGLPLFPVK